jgi:nitrogen-specific signal transduction histidine kinase
MHIQGDENGKRRFVTGDQKEQFEKCPPFREKDFSFLAREIRNALQAIWVAQNVIQRRADQQDEILAQAVRIVKEEMERLPALVKECLDPARPEKEKQILPADLDTLLTRVLTVTDNYYAKSFSLVAAADRRDYNMPLLSAECEVVKRAIWQIIK